jgi:hypothetical protein
MQIDDQIIPSLWKITNVAILDYGTCKWKSMQKSLKPKKMLKQNCQLLSSCHNLLWLTYRFPCQTCKIMSKCS